MGLLFIYFLLSQQRSDLLAECGSLVKNVFVVFYLVVETAFKISSQQYIDYTNVMVVPLIP